MRQIDLQEYEAREYRLSGAEKDALRQLNQRFPRLSLAVEPSGGEGCYILRPGATVGALELESVGLSLFIRPKLGIPKLLSLACYAMGIFWPRERQPFNFAEEAALPDTLAVALAAAARRAFARGLLHSYRTEEAALHTVRGRIRFDDQLKRRFSLGLPVEVQFDEFTDDILVNRLIKAAAWRLGRMPLRSAMARRQLGRVAAALDNVSLVDFPANAVPEVRFDRLNEHYRDVVNLARLTLRHSAFESDRGPVRANGFLVDMNQLFQEFVAQALREALNVSPQLFGERTVNSLDYGCRIGLRPDLVWQVDGICRFVGDAKYKKLTSEAVPNADLYQLLAYVIALDLPGGILIYAQGKAEAASYRVRHSGKMLEVAALNLSLPLVDVLEQVQDLADRVRFWAAQSRGPAVAPVAG